MLTIRDNQAMHYNPTLPSSTGFTSPLESQLLPMDFYPMNKFGWGTVIYQLCLLRGIFA